MKRGFLVLFLVFISSSFLLAQYNIQSRVFDEKNGEELELISVRLLNASDSAFIQGVQTDMKGAFMLRNVKKGNYILSVSSVGYQTHYENIYVEKNIILKNIQLRENDVILSEVEVKGTAAQMVVKGDTLEYNATAFKTAENAVVEDLLKRLPGVEISSDGKITINGEDIKKIRVDGKKFFDGDIEMATKNLSADMIEKIQVVDQKSEMAQLTGFDDGETERIINLTLKPNRKSGQSVNVTGGAGFDTNGIFRYDANGVANIMEGNSQSVITLGANNVNNVRSGRGRFSGVSGGVASTQNFGINNNTILNNKLKIGGNGSFNHSLNESIRNTYRLGFSKDSIPVDSTSTIAHNEVFNPNLKLELEWKPDSVNTFIIQPSINYSRSFNDNSRNFVSYIDDDIVSSGNNINYGNNTTVGLGLNLIYNRKFVKKGRTLTVNLGTELSQTDSESYNYSYKKTIKTGKLKFVDQFTENNSNGYNFNARISFVEPLWNVKNLLEGAVAFRSTTTTSTKDQYDNTNKNIIYDNLLEFQNNQKDYINLNKEYSNNYTNQFFNETVELNYKHVEKNYNLTLGVKGEPSQTFSYTVYGNNSSRDINNKVFNISPNGRFQYNFKKKEFIRIDYRGRTRQPSVNQMQPVKNNSNATSETIGNPDLNPEFSNNLRLFYSKFNDKRFSSFNTTLGMTFTKDALVSNTIYDSSGKRYNQTVNARDIPFGVNANVMYNTPVIKKRLHFNTRTNFAFNQRYGYSKRGFDVDSIGIEQLPLGDLTSVQDYTANEQLSLTFTHDIIELGIKGSVNYRKTINNLLDDPTNTWDWVGTGNLVLHLPYSINISSDINYTTLRGYANFDKNELIWNASIDKTLFKNKSVLSLRCYDILRQRVNISQTVGGNYTEFNSYNTLTSYFLLSFSYKLNRFQGSKSNNSNVPDEGLAPKPAMDGGRPIDGGNRGGGRF